MPFKLAAIFSFAALSAVLLAHPPARAQTQARQDPQALREQVRQFLQIETAGLPGQVTLTVGAIDARLNLAPCPAPQAFLAPGARPWGRTTVGVRCTAPLWTTYLQATVSVKGDYIAAAVPLAQGQPIEAGQLVRMSGELSALPAGIATEMDQVIGRSVQASLQPGTPIRLDTLRSKPVVLQGQLVRLISNGAGFSVSSEGRAIGNATEGQLVQVRTSGGQIVSGLARTGGVVEVGF